MESSRMQQHKASEIHLRCCMSTSIIFHCSVVFHHMNVPQFIYPYLRTLKLFPNLVNYKQNCSKNLHGIVVKNLPANAGDIGQEDPWVRKIPWSRKWQPAPVFWPENSMDRRAWWCAMQSMELQRVRHDWAAEHNHKNTHL